jgi:hypothetical protein
MLTEVLLVLPLVDTGYTARSLIEKIQTLNPTAQIVILAVLSTRGEGDRHGVIPPSSNTGGRAIHYLQQVSRSTYSASECPFCQAGIPRSDPRQPDPFDRLSAHAFWTLAEDVDFEEERDVPKYRGSVGQVPRLRALESRNGAFLAFKIEKLLRSTGNWPADPVVLCPLEDGTAAISDYLETVLNMTVIRVPKTVFNGHPEPAATVMDGASADRWLIQVKSLAEYRDRIRERHPVFGPLKANVIVFDEINVTGATRRNLAKFAAAQDLDVLCCISVIDFAGDDPSALSLYDVRLEPKPVSTEESHF